MNGGKLVLPVCLFGVFVLWTSGSAGTSLSNLTEECYQCLCHVATKCDLSHGCTGGYCGPFNISKIYWIDGGKYLHPDDEADVNHDWRDCAKEYNCAKKIVEGYLKTFEKDCNGDGEINCYDYMMLNGNGGYGCTAPLNRSKTGREWLRRYEECKL